MVEMIKDVKYPLSDRGNKIVDSSGAVVGEFANDHLAGRAVFLMNKYQASLDDMDRFYAPFGQWNALPEEEKQAINMRVDMALGINK